eukprot:3077978-Amphidinium_carterae.2
MDEACAIAVDWQCKHRVRDEAQVPNCGEGELKRGYRVAEAPDRAGGPYQAMEGVGLGSFSYMC